MKFGDYPTNSVTPIRETYFQDTWNYVLNAGENLFALSYTMPFAGSLVVELYAEIDHPGDQGPAVWLSVSNGSPAVSSSADNGVVQSSAGVFAARHELRTFAVWGSVSSGTLMNFSARLYCTAGGLVTMRYVGGFYRAMKT